MKSPSLLLGLAAMATAMTGTESESGLEARIVGPLGNPGIFRNNIMMFDCSQIPEVCTNMCYGGAFCLNIGVNLKWDRPDKKTIAARRRAAGCAPNPNRCSTKKGYKAGYNCDEYPFASTISNGKVRTRVNRCVPKKQNSKQGGTISKFYSGPHCKSKPNQACDFEVGFDKASGVKYCDAKRRKGKGKASKCKDGNEEIGPGGAKRRSFIQGRAVDNSTMEAPAHAPTYKTSSGSEIVVPGGAQIGQTVVRVKAVDQELWNAHAESHEFEEKIVDGYDTQYDYMHENLVIEEDTIVARID